MIRLAKLRLKNFKSFKNVTIPFSKGFTAIAGANGSGKSNVMDAVLFAMGETSLKSIRASRLTDLIYLNIPDSYAVVNLTFEDEKGEYELSRTVDKHGKSIYRLNEKRVTLGEISNLLKELGIRVDGHNMVVQGDLLRIIDMNELERRQVIDEVAGLQEFEEKKKEALKNLDKVETKIKDISIVLNERMSVIEQLAKEKETAQQYTRMEKELKQTKSTILHLDSSDLNEKLQVLLDKELVLIEKKEDSQNKRNDSAEKLKQAIEQFNVLDQEFIHAKNEAFESFGKNVQKLQSDIALYRDRLVNTDNRMNTVLVQEKELNEIMDKTKEEIFHCNSEEEEHHSELEKIVERMAPLQNKRSKALENKSIVLNDITLLEKKISEKRNSLIQSREKWGHTTAMLDASKNERNMHEQMMDNLEKQLVRIRSQKQSLNKELDSWVDLTQKFPDLDSSKKEIRKKLDELEEHIAHHHGKALTHKEYIDKLSKTKDNCPICSRELTQNQKKSLLDENEKQHTHFSQKTMELRGERDEAKKKWEELLNAEYYFPQIEKNKSFLSQLDKEEKNFSSQKGSLSMKTPKLPEQIISERKELEIVMEKQKKELDSLEKKLRELQDSINQTTMDEELNRLLEEQMRIEKEIILVQSMIQNKEHILSQSKNQLSRIKAESKELSGNKSDFSKKQKVLEKELEKAEKEYQSVLKSNQDLLENREKLRQKVENEREKERSLQDKMYSFDSMLSEIKIERSKFDTRLQDIKEELKNYEGVSSLHKKDMTELKKRIPVLESEMKKLGPINLKALDDFGHYEKDVLEIRRKVDILGEEKDAVMDLIQGIDLKRTEAFMECFNAINGNFNKLYMNFFDGTAQLSLTDPEKPLESGLIIEAKHGEEKRLKNIDSMSGGEKSLTSLAFIFSIQMYEPAPFYFFDEVDAALDLVNSQKIGKLVKEMSRNSQFVAITHNDLIIKVADRIIGVAKKNHESSVIGLKVNDPELEATSV